VGQYRNAWADAQVLIRDRGLVLINPVEDQPLNSLYSLVPVAPHTFRMEGEDGTGPVGELAVFELGADGRVARLRLGANYTYPLARS
jgi:hypothetical protein